MICEMNIETLRVLEEAFVDAIFELRGAEEDGYVLTSGAIEECYNALEMVMAAIRESLSHYENPGD